MCMCVSPPIAFVEQKLLLIDVFGNFFLRVFAN